MSRYNSSTEWTSTNWMSATFKANFCRLLFAMHCGITLFTPAMLKRLIWLEPLSANTHFWKTSQKWVLRMVPVDHRCSRECQTTTKTHPRGGSVQPHTKIQPAIHPSSFHGWIGPDMPSEYCFVQHPVIVSNRRSCCTDAGCKCI